MPALHHHFIQTRTFLERTYLNSVRRRRAASLQPDPFVDSRSHSLPKGVVMTNMQPVACILPVIIRRSEQNSPSWVVHPAWLPLSLVAPASIAGRVDASCKARHLARHVLEIFRSGGEHGE
jgi:hypothetical protein